MCPSYSYFNMAKLSNSFYLDKESKREIKLFLGFA